MIPEDNSKFAVLLSKPDQLSVPIIAKALTAYKQIPLPDAAFLAKRCWGIVEESCDKGTAELIKSKLSEAGINSLVLPRPSIATPPVPLVLSRAEFVETGIQVFPKLTGSQTLVWHQISLISAAGFNQTTTKTTTRDETPQKSPAEMALGLGIMLATGLPVGFKGKKKAVQKTTISSEFLFILDFFTREPLQRFRIESQNFDFSCLKERKGYDGFGNFRMMVLELIKKAPEAMKNRGAQIFLEGKPINLMGYETPDDIEREVRWLLTLAAQASD